MNEETAKAYFEGMGMKPAVNWLGQKTFVPKDERLVGESAAEKLASPNLSEVLDLNKIFENIEKAFEHLAGIFGRASSVTGPSEILNVTPTPASIFEAGSSYSDSSKLAVLEKLMASEGYLKLENLYYHVFELKAAVLCRKNGHVLHHDLEKINDFIFRITHYMSIISNEIRRLAREPWWNNPKNIKDSSNLSIDMKIQAAYCGIVDACQKFLEAAKELKAYDSGIQIDTSDMLILNLAPPSVQAEAKKFADTQLKSRARAKQRIQAKAAELRGLIGDFDISAIF
jgi:hypothetical protein